MRMTTGRVPFEGPNPFIVMNSRITGDPVAPSKRNPQISEQVEEIILHAMEREPAKRYQTAVAMKAELDDPDSVKLTGRRPSFALSKNVEDALARCALGRDIGVYSHCPRSSWRWSWRAAITEERSAFRRRHWLSPISQTESPTRR